MIQIPTEPSVDGHLSFFWDQKALESARNLAHKKAQEILHKRVMHHPLIGRDWDLGEPKLHRWTSMCQKFILQLREAGIRGGRMVALLGDGLISGIKEDIKRKAGAEVIKDGVLQYRKDSLYRGVLQGVDVWESPEESMMVHIDAEGRGPIEYTAALKTDELEEMETCGWHVMRGHISARLKNPDRVLHVSCWLD